MKIDAPRTNRQTQTKKHTIKEQRKATA